ncbi:hydrogenase formation protein (hypG) [Haemophilus influenzae Rd KW20]|uniref:Uncharacterized protein HI_1390 n=1 Tax=Haemophilus influenzae (strain ATCC 51907 / DSM 11121 / KW20 / Rd) TaxID=71421 RepID=Y1390_HAEIN|nr:RecName: Full=Uncharacterized protein HI_1390 [Haemophilus influenzae Rd KW20]AAC23037.1 hydrogenase formation protein (hypG) [Haemophilus influenzae Rd KW20]
MCLGVPIKLSKLMKILFNLPQ